MSLVVNICFNSSATQIAKVGHSTNTDILYTRHPEYSAYPLPYARDFEVA